MSNRKAVLISNPKTGRYVWRRTTPINELSSYLKSHGVDVELIMTAGPGDAAEIAARVARNGSADVIVAGGDGTEANGEKHQYDHVSPSGEQAKAEVHGRKRGTSTRASRYRGMIVALPFAPTSSGSPLFPKLGRSLGVLVVENLFSGSFRPSS